MTDSKTMFILEEVLAERMKQDEKWGEQNHPPFKWVTILGEEFGEVSKAALENDPHNYREELIQVAAVAIAAIENFDRVMELSLQQAKKINTEYDSDTLDNNM